MKHAHSISRITVAIALSFVFMVFPAHASHPTGLVNSSWDGFAIKGYDVVAYFTEGRAVEGKHDYSYNWLNLTWQFTSAEHRDLFIADPLSYAPQYGGYCATAPSVDGKPDVDPTAFQIINGQLYLFFYHDGMAKWASDESEVREAENIWKKVKVGLPQ